MQPGPGLEFLRKTRFCNSVFLHPEEEMTTGDLLGHLTKCWGITSHLASDPGGETILLVALHLCRRNRTWSRGGDISRFFLLISDIRIPFQSKFNIISDQSRKNSYYRHKIEMYFIIHLFFKAFILQATDRHQLIWAI